MNKEATERVFQISAAILGVSVSDISSDSSPANLSTWDSFQQIQIILAIEEDFNISFSEEDILCMNDMGAIADQVLKRLG
jgi:acyl carrier protein